MNPSVCREQLDTWNILARARNEGRLFSRLEWPKDPEIVRAPKKHTPLKITLSWCAFEFTLFFFVCFVSTEGASEAIAPPSYC